MKEKTKPTQPLRTFKNTGLPLRYIGLSEEDRARVAGNYLLRSGEVEPGEPLRLLTLNEAKRLSEEDFEL